MVNIRLPSTVHFQLDHEKHPMKGFRASMQVSMSHVFFNVFGACLWFVIPIMRKIPVGIAKFAARRTAKYRWWAVNYIIGLFFVFPILFFLLSLASSEAVTGWSTEIHRKPIIGPGIFGPLAKRSLDRTMCNSSFQRCS